MKLKQSAMIMAIVAIALFASSCATPPAAPGPAAPAAAESAPPQSEPISEPAPQPAPKPDSEPAPQPIPKPDSEVVAEPASQSVPEPAPVIPLPTEVRAAAERARADASTLASDRLYADVWASTEILYKDGVDSYGFDNAKSGKAFEAALPQYQALVARAKTLAQDELSAARSKAARARSTANDFDAPRYYATEWDAAEAEQAIASKKASAAEAGELAMYFVATAAYTAAASDYEKLSDKTRSAVSEAMVKVKAQADQSRKQAFDLNAGTYFGIDLKKAEDLYLSARSLESEAAGGRSSAYPAAVAGYGKAAEAYDATALKALPIFAENRRTEALRARDLAIAAGIEALNPAYLRKIDTAALAVIDLYNQGDYYTAYDGWKAACQGYISLAAGVEAYFTKEKIDKRNLSAYDWENYAIGSKKLQESLEAFEAGDTFKARAAADEAVQRLRFAYLKGQEYYAVDRGKSANVERQAALSLKADVIAKIEYEAAFATLSEADAAFIARKFDEASELYAKAESRFAVVQKTAAVPAGMVYIAGGAFLMGSPASEAARDTDEGPQRQVTVSAFYLSQHEVAFDEYDAFCDATGRAKPSDQGWGREAQPVINVSWYEAIEYCNWMSGQDQLQPAYRISGTDVVCDWNANGYRLPTEAEWEYACRAGTTTPFSAGENITTDQANYDGRYPYKENAMGEYRQKPLPVGRFSPNAWNLYDMYGNVWEWCWDLYGSYNAGTATDPLGAPSGSHRVARGGGWLSYGEYLRSAYRGRYDPSNRNGNLGFRLLRSIRETSKTVNAEYESASATLSAADAAIKAQKFDEASELYAKAESLFSAARKTAATSYDLVYIAGGGFLMGSPADEASRDGDEGPQRQVTVSAFYMGRHEVTFADFDAFCDATGRTKPSDQGWGRNLRPAINVSWIDTIEYCNWRSDQEKLQPVYRINGTDAVCDWTANGYRLPTEAEWEYACRAGMKTPFNTSVGITTNQANYDGRYPYNGDAKGEYRGKPLPVGSFNPNAWGLYDLHGNVWEWCWDRYGSYSAEAAADPRGALSGGFRVYRGGSYLSRGQYLRSAYRNKFDPSTRYYNLGFRLVRSAR